MKLNDPTDLETLQKNLGRVGDVPNIEVMQRILTGELLLERHCVKQRDIVLKNSILAANNGMNAMYPGAVHF